MPRALQLALGIVAVVVGLSLGAIIMTVWRPCAAAVMPLDPITSPACAHVASGPNTAWIGLLLWPVALAAAGLAAIRAISRGWGAVTAAVVVVLALAALAANPMVEYVLLNQVPQSWDEPPGTGSLTAALFVLAGLVIATTLVPRPRGGPRMAQERRWV